MSRIGLSKYHHVNSAVFNYVNDESKVLDIGCWDGSLGMTLLKKKHCIVDGIDIDKKALRIAKKLGYRRVYEKNLQIVKDLGIKNTKYDYIIFADILEHLLYPEEIMNVYLKYLKKNGKVIISLPNIGFLLYRIKLLFGKFEYKDIGVMDKTHVKFYTFDTMRQLFRRVGLEIIGYKKHNEVPQRLFLLQILKHLIPGLFTLQFVFLLKRITSKIA